MCTHTHTHTHTHSILLAAHKAENEITSSLSEMDLPIAKSSALGPFLFEPVMTPTPYTLNPEP